jgi:hypothetical protein
VSAPTESSRASRPSAVVTASGIVTARGTRRARILTHLEQHPDLTAYELAKALSITSSLYELLCVMARKGQVVATAEWRQHQGRRVSVWRIASPGTVPSPAAVAPEIIDHRRRRRGLSQRRRRARARAASVLPGGEIPATFADRAAAVLPSGAACLGTDPVLFFPEPGDTETEARALAVCAACPVRAACHDRAVRNGERFGIWGGVNFQTSPRPVTAAAGESGECQPGKKPPKP